MIPTWLVVCFVIDVVAAALVWAWINLTPAIKSNLRHSVDPPGEDAPLAPGAIAIITPGRNEADHLPRTLPAMCTQRDDAFRVVFVDDDSTDDTSTVTAALTAKHRTLHVLRLDGDPPAGWSGKCWALQRGYERLRELEAEGERAEWIVFGDSDIDWQPDVLRAARAVAAQHDADLIALFPKLRFGSLWEAVVQLQLVLALGIFIPMDRAMDPDHPQAMTSGTFMMVRRTFYDQIGGHAAVAGDLVDDIELGGALKQAGAKVRVGYAPKLLSCRMYESFADQWEGLTKNAYAGLKHRWWAAAGVATAAALLNVLPPVYVVIAAVWFARQPGLLSGATLGLAGLAVLMQARALNAVRKFSDLSGWYAWTTPIGSGLYMLILLASMHLHHTGGSHWKGRRFRGIRQN